MSTLEKREISKINLLFISFAAIFGSGWLFAPLYAAQIAGPASLIAWALGAGMSAVIGITMAEVVVLYPKSGGLTYVSKVAYGELLSKFVSILNLLVFIILPAIEVRAVLQYVSSIFKGLFLTGDSISWGGYFLSLFLLAVITGVNFYGAKVTALLTRWVVIFKVITPLLVCLTFLALLGWDGALNESRLSLHTETNAIPWNQVFQAIATSGIIFSFNGFNQATLFAGEAKNPQKAIPFAILGSLFFSAALYLLIQYVFLMAVPESALSNGWDKLKFAGDEGPFAGLTLLLGAGWLVGVIYVDAVVSPLGTAFSYASAAPRLFNSLINETSAELSDQSSRSKSPRPAFLQQLFKSNQYGVSKVAILFTFALECLAFVFLPNLKAMIALLVAAFVLCYTVAPASLLRLRKIEPDRHRPFRVWFAPFISFLSLFFSNLMVFSCGWTAIRNLIYFTSFLVIIYLFRVPKEFKNSHWFLFQLAFMGGLSWLDHVNPISFAISSLLIMGISFFTLLISQVQSSQLNRTN